MKSSRALIFHGSNIELESVKVPVPALRDGEILVRIEYTTMCRSDLHTLTGKRIEKCPTILGHEIVGRIEELHPSAPQHDLRGSALRVGDRVTWAIFASDPNSEFAQRGMPQKAPDLFKYGHEMIRDQEHLHGGLADYCILRKHTPVIRIDEQMPLGVAALLNCSVATCAGALRIAGDCRGKRVLIAGAGMLGICAIAMCHAAGAKEIQIMDPSAERRDIALRFGASSQEQLTEADILMDFSGANVAMQNLLSYMAIGSTLVFIGATSPVDPISIDPQMVIRKLLSIRGLHNYNAQDLVTAVNFLEENYQKYPFASLVEHGGSLSDGARVVTAACQSNAYRIGIDCLS